MFVLLFQYLYNRFKKKECDELKSVLPNTKVDPWGCFKMPIRHKTFVADCPTCQELAKELNK